jgi:thioredoxin 2
MEPKRDSVPETSVTLRCPFCATLNRVDLARAADRPKCGECQKPMLLDRPVKVEEQDFATTVLGADAPVLVDFYADWCAPCKMVAPLVDELARANAGRLLVAKVDTDRAPDLSMQHRIRGIPTLILFQAGGEVARSVGFEPEKLRSMMAGAA